MISGSERRLGDMPFERHIYTVNIFRRKNAITELLYMSAQARFHYVGWHWSFEFTIPDEVNGSVYDGFIDVQVFRENLLLSEGLSEWILKRVLFSIQCLRPFWLILRSKDPAFNVLCFYYE
jgi:hypothetical protein